jgi:broad specificity phosphatase PhoE
MEIGRRHDPPAGKNADTGELVDESVDELVLLRHGESVGNVAAAEAERSQKDTITVDCRDADVPLTSLGESQSRALGDWLGSNLTRPFSTFSSPYLRARQTLQLAVAAAGMSPPEPGIDDRLRDRELGILDLLTTSGVRNHYPEEARRRAWLGKLYYRPPGGESWADVALRLRSFLAERTAAPSRPTLVIACHDAIITLFIYVCLNLSEKELFDFVLSHTVSNASVTVLRRSASTAPWSLAQFADEEHLEEAGVPVTEHGGEKHV